MKTIVSVLAALTVCTSIVGVSYAHATTTAAPTSGAAKAVLAGHSEAGSAGDFRSPWEVSVTVKCSTMRLSETSAADKVALAQAAEQVFDNPSL